MNPPDILKYGHLTVLKTLSRIPPAEVNTPGAVGYWSTKDVVGHLASFELVLVEILENLVRPRPMPLTEQLAADGQAFNDEQVDRLRRPLSMAQVLDEYQAAHEQVRQAVVALPPASWRQPGILPWYGPQYDLEDFIVYTYYGHKREHSGQIAIFGDRFRG